MFSHLECSPATSVERVHKPHKIPLHLQLFSSCCCSCTDISSPPPPFCFLFHRLVSYKSQNALSTHCESCKKLMPQTPQQPQSALASASASSACGNPRKFLRFPYSIIEQIKRWKPQPEELGRCCCCWLRRAARTRRTRCGRARKKLQAPNEFLFLPLLFLLLLMLLAFRQS